MNKDQVLSRISTREGQVAKLKIKRDKANQIKDVASADDAAVQIDRLRQLILADRDLLAHLESTTQAARPGYEGDWMEHMRSVVRARSSAS